MMTDAQFQEAFETQRIAADQWRHRDHIRIAYLYLLAGSFDQAAQQLRTGIQALNASHGLVETLTRGYHETTTIAWLRLVQTVLEEFGPAADGDAFCDAHPELSQSKILRLFYTKDAILSPRAKAEFVEPDLTPLPVSWRRREQGSGGDRV